MLSSSVFETFSLGDLVVMPVGRIELVRFRTLHEVSAVLFERGAGLLGTVAETLFH